MKQRPRHPTTVARRLAAVIITGVTFYVIFPALLRVASAWPHLSSLAPAWLLLVLGAESISFFCSVALQRLVLRISSWFVVTTASLAGNAVTNVLPGGDAVGASVQYQMLVKGGIDSVQAASGLATSSLLGIAGLFALPVFALPAILGGLSVKAGLEFAALLGLGGLVLIVASAVVILRSDRVLRSLASFLQWLVNRLHRRRVSSDDLAARLLSQRNLVRSDLGKNWQKAVLWISGRIGFDYLCLLAALRAAGARPNPSLVLLAYAATAVIALVPLTPGGLGIVEASLSGLLVLAGVKASNAVLATLAYRLASYWMPIVAGTISYALFRRRFGTVTMSCPDSQPIRPVTP